VATSVSISGSGNVDVTVYGRGTVIAGNGNDSIDITGKGRIIVGSGHDTLTLGDGGQIWQSGASGVDTINLGGKCATVYEQGQATVSGAFGQATISGGVLDLGVRSGSNVQHSAHRSDDDHEHHHDDDRDRHNDDARHGFTSAQSGSVYKEIAVSGHLTLQGGAANTEFVGGSGWTVMQAGTGNDTFVGGSGHDTMIGGSGHDIFQFHEGQAGGQHVIENFVSGQDHLFIEGHSLDYLQSHHDVTTSGGNTFITIDGGKTTIELQGVTSLKASDITGQNH
jgi:Ca2+-binding RTX toxin-like protein